MLGVGLGKHIGMFGGYLVLGELATPSTDPGMQVYENCQMFSKDGELLCHTGELQLVGSGGGRC